MILDKITQWWSDIGPYVLLAGGIIILVVLIFIPRNKFGLKRNFKDVISSLYLPEYNLGSNVKNKNESYCRTTLETMLGRPFPSERPNFLRNPETGRNLECDMINHDLKLAVEYSGAQHYHYNPHFHRTYEAFRKQQERDVLKKQLLQNAGYNFIEVPYTIPMSSMGPYLKMELQRLGYVN